MRIVRDLLHVLARYGVRGRLHVQAGRLTVALHPYTLRPYARRTASSLVGAGLPDTLRSYIPPTDMPRSGLLAKMSSDLARLTGREELTISEVDACIVGPVFVALARYHSRRCDCLKARRPCLPIYRWLATEYRFARIESGAQSCADVITTAYPPTVEARP